MNYNLSNSSSSLNPVFSDIIPGVNDFYNIGSSTYEWLNFYVKNMNVKTIKITDTTQSTSPTTGAVVISGGVGVGKNISVGNNINMLSPNAAQTVGIYNVNGGPFMHCFDAIGTNTNTFLGYYAGANTASMTNAALNNVGIGGGVLTSATSAQNNVALGYLSCNLLTSGTQNVCAGLNTLSTATSASGNVALGTNVLTLGTTNSCAGNVGVGQLALDQLQTGATNVCIGYQAGHSYTTNESNNILLSNTGTIADSGTIRIGTPGVHTKGYIPGVLTLGNSSNTTEGIKLANSTSSYTPTLLNYYESTTASVTFTNYSTPQVVSVRLQRIGSMVNIYIPGVFAKFGASVNPATAVAGSIPTRFAPVAQTRGCISVQDLTINTVGVIIFGTDGSINVYRDVNGNGFSANSTLSGFADAFSTSWSVT